MEYVEKHSQRDLLEIACDVFSDSADPAVFQQAYHPDGTAIKDFPVPAQKFVFEAREKFFRSGENEFHVDIDLGQDHHFENKSSITPEVINQIRPIFAAEYLKHIGMANSAAAVRLAQKLLPITADNIEIHTRKKGYNMEQLIINQNAKIHAKQSVTRNQMTKKCKTIRNNFLSAWAQIDNEFPTETRKPLPGPFKPGPHLDTIRVMRKVKMKKDERCPTSVPRSKMRNRPKPQANPFIGEFPLILPRSEIESIVLAFVDRFDFLSYLKAGIRTARDCIEFLRNGVCPRILYHVARYMHSILVLNSENLTDFIRARALWHIIYQKLDDSIISFRFVSVALMMIKACTFVLFEEHSELNSFSDIEIMQSTLFSIIDRFLNPFQIFDSLEKEEDYRAKITPLVLETGEKILDDIYILIDKKAFQDDEEKIAKLIINPQGMHELLCLLGSESWGDASEFNDESRTRHRYNETRIVQKMIEMDIEKLNLKMPRKPPKWVQEDPNQITAVSRPNRSASVSYRARNESNVNKTPQKIKNSNISQTPQGKTMISPTPRSTRR